MLISEQEAKERLCPQKIAWKADPLTHLCHGSDCLAWRWGQELEIGQNTSALLGYCGLAGKPEEKKQ